MGGAMAAQAVGGAIQGMGSAISDYNAPQGGDIQVSNTGASNPGARKVQPMDAGQTGANLLFPMGFRKTPKPMQPSYMPGGQQPAPQAPLSATQIPSNGFQAPPDMWGGGGAQAAPFYGSPMRTPTMSPFSNMGFMGSGS